jgi:hypothetical protein
VTAAVETILWPAESRRRLRAALAGTPRLLVVPVGTEPPRLRDLLEDWTRADASEVEVASRTSRLAARASSLGDPGRLRLDPDGTLRWSTDRRALPPTEARLLSALLAARGDIVSRELLKSAAWPARRRSDHGLDRRVCALRHRVETFDLEVQTIVGVGYAVTVGSGRPSAALTVRSQP